MPARSIASATISFGLVSVPVNLFSTAESSASISFNMLDKKTGTRLKQQYVSTDTNPRVVEKDDIVKGYEVAKNNYVVFSPEELKALDEKATNSIDIVEFVPLDRVDRIYLDKAYFLGPDKGGDRAYRLLSQALEETGYAALGQYAARGRQNLVLVRPMNGVLVMEQLHYANELRSAAEVPLEDVAVKPAELTLAKQLIEQTATDEFKPEKYHDQVRERVREAIQQKVDGQEITAEPQAQPQTKIIDLMEALKASLGRAEKAGKGTGNGERGTGKSTKSAKKTTRKAS
jgi:DNA end-binding protein Ku